MFEARARTYRNEKIACLDHHTRIGDDREGIGAAFERDDSQASRALFEVANGASDERTRLRHLDLFEVDLFVAPGHE